MQTQQTHSKATEKLILALLDNTYVFTPLMVEAIEELYREFPTLPAIEKHFMCPYCTQEHASNSGTGSDISCCGEVGHAEILYSLKGVPISE